ncbi:MAG: sensor histidine kinase [Pararhizobium sp.]
MTSESEPAVAASKATMRDDAVAVRPKAAWQYSIRTYLIVLLLIVLIPAFLFSAVVLVRTTEAQNHSFRDLFVAATHSVAELVDREASGMLTTLRVLSTASSLQQGELPQFYDSAKQALAGTASYLTVVDRNMNQLMSTSVAYGHPLAKSPDPQSAKEAFSSGWPIVSNLFYDTTDNRWSFNVSLPVKIAKGKTELLVLTQPAANFDDLMNTKRIPAGWSAALVDANRNVVASSSGPGGRGRAFYIPFDKGLSSGFTEVQYQGVDFQLVVQPSDITGWSVVSWAPTEVAREAISNSLMWLIAGGLAIAAIATTGAYAIARGLSSSDRQISSDARKLGAGETVEKRDHPIAEFSTVSAALARAARERKTAENEIRFLMREVAHRSKNQLTVIQAMLNQTAKLTESKDEFAEAFRKRVAGLARSTDLMITNANQGVDLGILVSDQLETFRPTDPTRVRVKGPEVRLDSQAAQVMGMAIHELSTNAAKYGAFSGTEGVVDISWRVADDAVRFVWRESGVEIDDRPERKGFGSIVLERILGMSLGAELERVMHDDGIEWIFSIPLEKLHSALGPRA